MDTLNGHSVDTTPGATDSYCGTAAPLRRCGMRLAADCQRYLAGTRRLRAQSTQAPQWLDDIWERCQQGRGPWAGR
jgi:hypothetical protein